jgi:hypothetical protein
MMFLLVCFKDLDGSGVLPDRLVVISSFDVDEPNSSNHVCQLQMMVFIDTHVGLGRFSCRHLTLVEHYVLLKLGETCAPTIVVLRLCNQTLGLQSSGTFLVDFFQSV